MFVCVLWGCGVFDVIGFVLVVDFDLCFDYYWMFDFCGDSFGIFGCVGYLIWCVGYVVFGE